MTEEISKKIFQTCGVAPISYSAVFRGKNTKFTISSDTLKNLKDLCERIKPNEKYVPEPNYYDLGEPENFVRFQEILYKNGCNIHFYDASNYESSKLIAVSLVFDSWSDCAEDFKTALLKMSKKFLAGFEDIECYFENKLREQLKQAIKAADWKV